MISMIYTIQILLRKEKMLVLKILREKLLKILLIKNPQVLDIVTLYAKYIKMKKYGLGGIQDQEVEKRIMVGG